MMYRIRNAGGTLAILFAVAALLAAAATLAGTPRQAEAQGTGCNSQIDLMLVLDGSESINWAQWDVVKQFAGGVVGQFIIGPDDGRIGVVQFASEGQGRIEVGLTGDQFAIENGIANMLQIVGVTDIQEGIALAQGQLTANGRIGVPHVIVVVTDGAHNQPGDPVAEAALARSLGTEIFAIAVGDGPKRDELDNIVSEPIVSHVVAVDDFDGLVAVLHPLVQEVCPPTATPTPPVAGVDTPPFGTPPSDGTPPFDGTPPGMGTPVSGVEGITRLPATGGGLPNDWAARAGWLSAQAAGGLIVAFGIVGAGYLALRRRERR